MKFRITAAVTSLDRNPIDVEAFIEAADKDAARSKAVLGLMAQFPLDQRGTAWTKRQITAVQEVGDADG